MQPTWRLAEVEDEEYARRIHHLAYRDVVERQFGGWDEDKQDGFFAGSWSQRQHEILEWGGEPCGYMAVEIAELRVDLHELVLHPDFQNRGIGTAALAEVLARSEAADLPVYLQVLRENRAAVLYERTGFEEYDQSRTHRLMRLVRDR